METPEDLRSTVKKLNDSILTAGAIAAALQERSGQTKLGGPLAAAVDEVLGARGVKEAVESADATTVQALLAEVRVTVLQVAEILTLNEPRQSWSPQDTVLLSAAGEVSAGFPRGLQRLLPSLPGLAERLASPEGAFLDIGTGVGRLAIEMARLWPSLRIVGLEVWERALEMARRNVAESGFAGRIELRLEAAQNVTDRDAFDLCWVPSVFIRPDVIPAIVERAFAAVRPGGWILFAAANTGGDQLAAALAKFRTSLAGGALFSREESQSLLKNAGFVDVKALPGPPQSLAVMVAGRRGEATSV